MSEHKPIVLELNEVSLSYHAGGKAFDHGMHHVLKDVSINLYESETLGIIGRNGVGKTTLLRVMAGILAPTKGRVKMEPEKSASLLTLGSWFQARSLRSRQCAACSHVAGLHTKTGHIVPG